MMRGFRSLAWVLAKLALREPLAVFFTLVLPAGLVALFGLAFGNVAIPLGDGRGGMDHQLPAIAAWVFAMTGLFTVPMALLGRRDAGTLRRFQVTPLRPATYLAADVVVHLGQALLGLALLFAVGAWAFGARGGGSPLVVVGAALLDIVAFLAFGYALAALLPNARAVPVVGNVLAVPMLFLSGATAPLEVMPAAVQRVAQLNPLYHAVTLLRGAWFGEPWSALAGSAAVIMGLLVGAAAFAAWRFRWDP
jgi:ABC-2 type transport system permease protein